MDKRNQSVGSSVSQNFLPVGTELLHLFQQRHRCCAGLSWGKLWFFPSSQAALVLMRGPEGGTSPLPCPPLQTQLGLLLQELGAGKPVDSLSGKF